MLISLQLLTVSERNVNHTGFFGLLLLLIIITLVYITPIISILISRKTSGSEKLAWILAVLFISWFAWIFYLLLAPIKKK